MTKGFAAVPASPREIVLKFSESAKGGGSAADALMLLEWIEGCVARSVGEEKQRSEALREQIKQAKEEAKQARAKTPKGYSRLEEKHRALADRLLKLAAEHGKLRVLQHETAQSLATVIAENTGFKRGHGEVYKRLIDAVDELQEAKGQIRILSNNIGEHFDKVVAESVNLVRKQEAIRSAVMQDRRRVLSLIQMHADGSLTLDKLKEQVLNELHFKELGLGDTL